MAEKETYKDKHGDDLELEELLVEKNEDQVLATKFMKLIPVKEGCFKKEYLTYEGYKRILHKRRGAGDYKNQALRKLGLDEEQVKEIDPVCFEGYRYYNDKLEPYLQLDGSTLVSSMYQITWLFFGEEQMYLYDFAFDTTDNTHSEQTKEYFYQDITAFSTSSDSLQHLFEVKDKNGDPEIKDGKRVLKNRTVNTELFKIVVPGDSFACSLEGSTENHDMAIRAMKQKLREVKNAR